MAHTQKISTNLWFDKNGQDAVDFYLSVFKNGSKGRTTYYGKEGFEIHRMPEGTPMVIEFTLEGHDYLALNGGPVFQFNEAISQVINCESQEEIDHYWNKLTKGGDEKSQQCGWLKDKFGLSWQVVPSVLAAMISDPDAKKAGRVMNAMLQMKKIIIADLEKAFKEEA